MLLQGLDLFSTVETWDRVVFSPDTADELSSFTAVH